MKARTAIVLMSAAVLICPVARSGHEQSVYPSYYPHEIEITTVAPERAADLMRAGKLHAYVGRSPQLADSPGDAIGAVKSLGSFVVVRLNPQSPLARDNATACAGVGAIVRSLRAKDSGLIAHPYPVTPYHGDYLHHADRAEAARQRLMEGGSLPVPDTLKVRAESESARRLVRPDWLADGGRWDAVVEEIETARLVAQAIVMLNGWMGPPWVRSGWFHAYSLLASAIAEPSHRQQVDTDVARLQAAEHGGSLERINLERELVASLTASCRAAIAGYTVKREYFNAGFSAGVENIGFDAFEGLSSPMFLRTVKLKDFPWNGWLQLGLEGRPSAAWNPIGGFTDDFGRLMWFAIGDPAAIPSPYESAWMLNRISEVEQTPRR